MQIKYGCLLACSVLAVLLAAVPATAYPSISNYYRDGENQYDPEEIMEMLNRLGNLLQVERKLENEKRGLDLGFGRGYSGALQAKHLMGLAAANYAGGPGRRRRDLATQ